MLWPVGKDCMEKGDRDGLRLAVGVFCQDLLVREQMEDRTKFKQKLVVKVPQKGRCLCEEVPIVYRLQGQYWRKRLVVGLEWVGDTEGSACVR